MQPELRTTNLAQLHGLLFFSPCFYTTVKTSEVTYQAWWKVCGLERLNRSRFGSLILPLISSDALGKTLLCLDLSFHIYKMEVIKPTLRGHCEKYQQSMKNGMFALGCRRTLITGSYPDCPSQSTPGQQQMAVQGVKSWHIAILPQHILQVWSQCIERTFIKTKMKRLSTKESMLLNSGAGEDSWESLRQQDQTSQF